MFSTCLPRFDTLAPRPPTPPRDLAAALDQAVEFLDDSHEVDRVLKGTPTNSSSSPKTTCTPDRAGLVANQADADSANPTKRVDFSPWPVFHEHGLPGLLSSPTSNTEKNTPSARDAKPIRSILKQSLGPLPPTPEELESTLNYFSPQEPGSFLKMLQSVINQLSSARQDQRLDAYLTLNGVLRAHEGIPDPQSMASRMGLLMQFISRDMVCKNATGNLDTNIVVQALNLASSIMYNAQLAVNLDDDFKTNLLDRSIHILEQPGIPKQVMKLHIHILAYQNFHAGILTPGKADRMVIALRNMEERCTGNTAIAMRLDICKRLLVQAPKIMLTRVREWLNHGFYGMLSPSNEIRSKAIDTMHFAGLTLGTEPPASKAIRDMFDSELKDGKTFFEYFVAQMEQMIADKEIGPCVPQMWSIVIFFFRNRRAPLEKWPKFKSWLMIIQRCLNSSDLSIRRQAMLSWNKLISAVLPDQTTSRNFFAMLRVPIAGGLEKRGNDSHARQFRQSAHESFLYLLYYALRPGLSLPELDSAWDVYVAPTLIDMIKTSKTGVTTACQILLNLLSIKATGWNINVTSRAAALTMDELPRLEPRWTRSRAAKLVHILEPIISQTLCDVSEDAILLDAVLAEWLGAIAEAGAHEIKMSNDLKEAIAVLTNLLQRLWQSKMQTSAAADLRIFCQRFLALVEIILTTIGPGPLSEDILSKNSENGAEVAFTPSSRHPKQQGEPHSSLSVLFGCLYRTTSAAMEMSVVDSYVSIADGLLRHIVSVRPSGSKKIELLQRLLQVAHDSNSSNTAAAPSMWCAVARSAEAILQTPHELPESGDSQNLGLELRNATSILSTGLSYANDHSACMALVLQLQDAMSITAKSGAGSGGVVVAVIEPLSKLLLEDRNVFVENKILLATSIIKTAGWPRNRHELDQSRKQLWGAGLPAQRSAVFDPYEHFYRLICSCMLQTYESFESSTLKTNLFSEILEAVTGLLERCPSDMLSVSLRKVQDGFAIWIHDSDRKTATARAQAELILSAWKRVLHLVETLAHKDSNLVRALEALLVAGFSSPRKAIVNETILFWNRSFESLDTLEYPPNLEKVLRVRLQEAEITVPGFPESHDELDLPSLPAFFESQDDLESSPSRPNNAHELSPRTALASRAHPVSPFLKPMQMSTTHSNNLSSPPKDGITPSKKLRHEDSQIQFEPIDSSPVRYEESQLLTEHQKETMARQHDNAHMFAGLSSSPVKPTSPRRSMQKKLDFTSDRSSRVMAITTPSRDQNADVPPSDDMPSSPTPSSTRAGNSKFLNLEDMAVDDDNDDPPSSPPRAHEEELDDTTIVATDALDDDNMECDPFTDGPQQQLEILNPACVEPAPVTLSSSVPAIAEPGPSAEAEVSAERIEETDYSTKGASLEPLDAPDVGQVGGLGLDDADLSRVQNSFPDSSSKSEQSAGNTHDKTPGSTSKRKHASGGFSSARKRLSTLSRMASFLWGSQDRNNDDEDSDVGEDIAVASSQVASSPPARPAVHVVVPLQSNSAPAVIEDAAESPKAAVTEPTNTRRRRGRKDTTAYASSQPQQRITRSLKRRASSMDPGLAAGDNEEPNNGVDSTPTPAKIRRSSRVIQKQNTGESAGVEPEASAENPESAPELASSTTNILCTTPKRNTSTVASVETIASPVADRAILTPRRMLARLREVLVDLPKIVLGKDDEREFDDVLYQVRTQMHRAATRGEAQEAAASTDGNGASDAQ